MLQFFVESDSTESLRDEYLDEVVAGRMKVNASSGQRVALGADCELVFIHPVTAECLSLGAEVIEMRRKASHTDVEIRLSFTGPRRRKLFEIFLEKEGSVAKELPQAEVVSRAPSSPEALVLDLIHSPESSEESPLIQGISPDSEESRFASEAPSIDALNIPETPETPALNLEVPAVEQRDYLRSSAPPKELNCSVRPQGKYSENIHLRIRKLSAPERERAARSGGQAERVALERAYGATLWEAILSNPQVTGPEVAKIAKNRTVSSPILQIIVGNRNWLNRPEIKRGLLSNTRLQPAQIEKVLSSFKRIELKQIQKQTAYPQRVRQAVARILGTAR